ncbi:HAD-IIB family hydrolase [Candidatus Kaiserbacteria bacterium]|nr:HAD-IIB family hydrolase [Candidatus Kaiserbacteria bacterium]
MDCPRVAIFDLDDTLAESFQPPSASMVVKLSALLEKVPVAILSAAGFPRIEADFLHKLTDSPRIDFFYIFPNSSAQCFIHENGKWKSAYDFLLSAEQRQAIRTALDESVRETNLELNPKYEPVILDRDVQIAYAALGLDASEEDKRAWDPDKAKRKRLKESLDKRLPDFEVLIGGKTTMDITHKGINKAYGVRWLSKKLSIPASEMLYVGDAFYEGGNDTVVIPTGIRTRAVSGPAETETVIDELLNFCA